MRRNSSRVKGQGDDPPPLQAWSSIRHAGKIVEERQEGAATSPRFKVSPRDDRSTFTTNKLRCGTSINAFGQPVVARWNRQQRMVVQIDEDLATAALPSVSAGFPGVVGFADLSRCLVTLVPDKCFRGSVLSRELGHGDQNPAGESCNMMGGFPRQYSSGLIV